jgi:hypothetical protein
MCEVKLKDRNSSQELLDDWVLKMLLLRGVEDWNGFVTLQASYGRVGSRCVDIRSWRVTEVKV